MDIEIKPKSVFTWLLLIIVCLMLANVVAIISMFHGGIPALINLFYLDAEVNIPSFYASFSLLLCSILLAVITITHKRLDSPYAYWLGLTSIFFYLSLDELISLHERIVKPVRDLFHTSGVLYFAWVIPYLIALAIFLSVYFKFLTNLPKRIRILFVLSGGIYIAGAIGIEMIGSQIYESSPHKVSLAFAISTTCEEFFEMIGIAIFIYALLLYITQQFKKISITIVDRQKLLI